MPTSIISTNEEEFSPELIALADKFEEIDLKEQNIVDEEGKLLGHRTAMHVEKGRILKAARDLTDDNQIYGKWRQSRASLQRLSKSVAANLIRYVSLLPLSSAADNEQEDTTSYPSEGMCRKLLHTDIPTKVAQTAVADHISGKTLLDYDKVKEIRQKYITPKEPKQISMADRATIELRLAVQPHLTGESLLGCGFGACNDSIKILAKHFRQKHHPDKGGSQLDYLRINDAAAEALKNVR